MESTKTISKLLKGKDKSRGRPRKLRILKKDFRITLEELEENPYKIMNFPDIKYFWAILFKINAKYSKSNFFGENNLNINPLPEKKIFLEENLIGVDPNKKQLMLFYLLIFYQFYYLSSFYHEIHEFLFNSMKMFVSNKEIKLSKNSKQIKALIGKEINEEIIVCFEILNNLFELNFKK